jgi:predicted aldo/keto reductase-like oxidoreductase
VHAAIDTGITCFDTADAYGMGVSEEALARALAGRRNDVVIATKFGVGYEEMSNRRDSSRARVLASIDKSLRRLRTDHVDIYLVHWPDPNTPLEETMAALDDIARQGKVRYMAISTKHSFNAPCTPQLTPASPASTPLKPMAWGYRRRFAPMIKDFPTFDCDAHVTTWARAPRLTFR